jgi:hypothetical protein
MLAINVMCVCVCACVRTSTGPHIHPAEFHTAANQIRKRFPCATLALKTPTPEPLFLPSQRRLRPMGFLFLWYFVYGLCGQIRAITVKVLSASCSRLQLADIRADEAGGNLCVRWRAVQLGDANAH